MRNPVQRDGCRLSSVSHLRNAAKRLAASATLALGLIPSVLRAVPAFPGAEGQGANAKGARAVTTPTLYRVTNLNDSGTGSFRDAVSASGRVIVFDVGGIIRVGSPIVFSPSLTILGQTAPGEGVTLYGNRVSFSGANNTICRYLRIRMGIDGDDGADAIGIANGSDMIFDHVSASWGRDETFSISGDSAIRITLQDCLIAQGLRIHSAGGLMQTSGGVSIFRTLYADNWMRNPKVKGVNDYINNVVYNWGGGGGYIPAGDSAGDSYANIINNYFIAGPETGVGRSPFSSGNTNFRLYHSGNLEDLDLDGTLDAVAVTNSRFSTLQLVGTRFPYPGPTTELSAPAALNWVLDRAGVSHRRDRTDAYVVDEVRSWGTTGAFIFNESEMGGIGSLNVGQRAPDADNDGMPDWWEVAAGSNPSVSDSMTLGSDGYLNIERYANALVVGGVPGAFITAISLDSGASASDGITSDRTLVLSGTATPNASIAIRRADTGLLGTVTATAGGTWSFDYSATSLPDRVYAFTATATSGSVTTPPSPAFVVTVDNVAALAPTITGLALTPTAQISGRAGVGDTVVISLDGVTVGTAVADSLGNWIASYVGIVPTSGVRSFLAIATDLAGNTGPASAAYTVDFSIAAPAFSAISTDSGASATDEITNDTTLTLSGTAPANSTVNVSRDGVGVVGLTLATAGGTFSFNYTGTALPAGNHRFTATATVSGNASAVSAPFAITVDTTAPAVSSIRRQNPSTYSTNGGTVVFRATFSEPVSGVNLTDFTLTNSGASATLSSVASVSSTVYDVTVTGVSGDGTVRVNLASSGTGIVDVAGNAISGGYTSGQTYTVRLAGSGVWINLDDDGLWSDSVNWDGGLIAGGTGATADFSLRDLQSDTTLILDSSRTLGRIVIGDTDFSTQASWTISDGGIAGRSITLSGSSPNLQVDAPTSQLGDTTDVPAAASFPQRLAVNLIGSSGFTKIGVGTLELNRPNPSLTGPLTITKGIVQVGVGGELRPSSVTIATSQQLRVAGGTFSTTGNTSWNSGTGTGVIVSAGTASFQDVLPSNARNSFFRVTGGTVTGRDINFPRSGDSESQTTGTGVLISGGDTTFRTVGLGTNNSWAGMTISGGRITVTDTLNVGFQASAGRGGVIYLSGGELVVTGATNGLVMTRKSGTNVDNVAKLLITGGTAKISKMLLGFDSTVTDGTALVSVNPGALYLGSGGIVKNGTSGLASTINLNAGTLGALENWSTSHPMNLTAANASFVLRAATPEGVARDMTFSGALSGVGGFTKTGGGVLTLAASSTLGDSVNVNEGTLRLNAALASASGKLLSVNNGGTLEGSTGPSFQINLNSGGTLSPGGNTASTWTLPALRLFSGARLRMNLGSTADRLNVSSAVSFGSASGTITFSFIPGTLTPGTTYTLVSGPVSLGNAVLAHEGLGFGTGTFLVSPTSISFRLDSMPNLTDLQTWMNSYAIPVSTGSFDLDADGDGLPVLLEYVFGESPSAPGPAAGLAAGSMPETGGVYPTINYKRRIARGDVVLTVEAAGPDMNFAAGPSVVEVSSVDLGNGFQQVVARTTTPLATQPVQFLRVRASIAP